MVDTDTRLPGNMDGGLIGTAEDEEEGLFSAVLAADLCASYLISSKKRGSAAEIR